MNYEESKQIGELLMKHKNNIAVIAKDKTYQIEQILHMINDEAMILKISEVLLTKKQ